MMRDFELANGLQDADLEMRELEAAAARNESAKNRGKCPHGWYRAWADGKTAYCHDCGATFIIGKS